MIQMMLMLREAAMLKSGPLSLRADPQFLRDAPQDEAAIMSAAPAFDSIKTTIPKCSIQRQISQTPIVCMSGMLQLTWQRRTAKP
ncbi:MAG: hypothetical protein EOS23_31690 [Mesorhizobium sp.]|uniref:hypothetical protein n=1 Tax=Mesorhizobium sp. TaxID=1871066 RepID=UPI000FE4FED9|nr:hypothetical protein [Mesorhizobium sp.]RWE06181.1 MAG: hypothetical protein EOS23_31690 [Mesorhizobium sp.]TIU09261.1 MAG: hypothetical protein E5W39_03290 [Mesorhizobium sp.]TIV81284.1 MAG: hypothetical protein E5V64_16640 [Mesorhizobium sp.]